MLKVSSIKRTSRSNLLCQWGTDSILLFQCVIPTDHRLFVFKCRVSDWVLIRRLAGKYLCSRGWSRPVCIRVRHNSFRFRISRHNFLQWSLQPTTHMPQCLESTSFDQSHLPETLIGQCSVAGATWSTYAWITVRTAVRSGLSWLLYDYCVDRKGFLWQQTIDTMFSAAIKVQHSAFSHMAPELTVLFQTLAQGLHIIPTTITARG